MNNTLTRSGMIGLALAPFIGTGPAESGRAHY